MVTSVVYLLALQLSGLLQRKGHGIIVGTRRLVYQRMMVVHWCRSLVGAQAIITEYRVQSSGTLGQKDIDMGVHAAKALPS